MAKRTSKAGELALSKIEVHIDLGLRRMPTSTAKTKVALTEIAKIAADGLAAIERGE